ncbi:MAG: DUF2950 domain-containing protein [Syntrophobacter sp.]
MLWSIKGNRKYIRRPALIFMLAAALFLAGFCGDGSAAVKKSGQEAFSSPEEACTAFFQAVKDKDRNKLLAVLGADARDLIESGDPVADAEGVNLVTRLYEEKIQILKSGDRKAVITVGSDNWPFPLPVVERNGKWRFDTKAGRQEVLDRRIGKNELSTIQVCRGYVAAQREYAAQPHDASGLLAYAQKFFSEPGKQDGLYWQVKEGEPPSPVGIFMAAAYKEGYREGNKPSPYHGYFFRILKAQGKNAPGGAYDYVANGRMIGGFALIAYPAKYGVSGIMTFIVNQNGEVYERNLGPKTELVAQAIKLFDPDKSWRQVK